MSWHIVMMEEPGIVSPRLRSFSPDISALYDNTSISLFAPDVRILDAQQHP
jgi:hypothetical protein